LSTYALAPAASDSRAYSSSSYIVTTTTPTPGEASTKLGIASRLGVPGILRSTSRMRGRSSRVSASAASASPASPTTSKSSSSSSSRRRPLRTSAWSSAMTIVIGSSATSTGSATVAGLYPETRAPRECA
jgi:hypothetical protein